MIETIPIVMQFMRRQMRKSSPEGLSVPQLRTLYYINAHDHPSLSDTADFIGLSLPAMSRLVDALVRRKMVTRASCTNDRRQVRLAITEAGKASLNIAWDGAHVRLTRELAAIPKEDRDAVMAAMQILRTNFDPDVVKD